MAIFSTIERRNYRAAVDNCAKFEATAKRILDKAEADGRDLTEAEREDIDRLMGKMAAAQSTLDAFRLRVDESLEAVIARESWEQESQNAAVLQQAKSAGTRGKVFATLGDQLAAVMGAANGRHDERLARVEQFAGMNSGIGSEGGFAVEPAFVADILRRVHDTGMLAKRCRTFELGEPNNGIVIPYVAESSRADGSRLGGVRAYRVSEQGTITDTQPSLGRMEIKLSKMAALCHVSSELLQDNPLLGRFVTDAFVEELAFKLDSEIFNGNGGAECIGIMNSDALVVAAKDSPSQTADTVSATNIARMWARLWPRSRRSAVWLVSPDAEAQLFTLTIGEVPVFQPANGMADAPFGRLLGRPIIPFEGCSPVGDLGDIVLADLNEYIVIRKAMQAATSIHVKFLTDEQSFRLTWRVNGQPAWSAPLTPYNGGDTLSPFVALEAR